MAKIQEITDDNWQSIIGDKPALILISTGNGLRGEFITQFKKSATATDSVIFAEFNPEKNPDLAQTFNYKNKPIMIGYHCGDVPVRRVRPWGTDVVLAIELLENQAKEKNPEMANNEETPQIIVGEPVNVTDNDFQEQVVDFSNEMPVVVDFWADWCGPCKMVAPILDKLAGEFEGQIRIAKVDTDANQTLAQSFRIMSIPTIMVFKKGHIIFSQAGALPEPALRDLFQQAIDLDIEKALAEHAENNPEDDSN